MKNDEPPSSDNGSDPRQAAGPDSDPRPRRWRFGLMTLVLLMTAIASWIAYAQQRRRIHTLEVALGGLREVARELVVEDETQYAAVRKLETAMDDFRWQIFLPAGRQYVMRLALEGIEDKNFPPPVASTHLSVGIHAIELRYHREPVSRPESKPEDQQWKVAVLVDGEASIEIAPEAPWGPTSGSTGGSNFGTSRQQPIDQPLELFRRRFNIQAGNSSSTPTGPANGILLYIEPAK